MKIKTIISVLLAFQLSVHAQEPKKKPSWTVSMPERDDAPGLKMQIEDEDEDEDGFGMDRDSLGFDRDELSSAEDATQESTSPKMTNKIEIQKQLDNEHKKNVAQQAKIKKLEAEKLEAEKLEAEKLEAEKLAQKIQAEQEKITAQNLAEKKLKNQKQNQEISAAQKLVEQEKSQQENKSKEIVQQKPKSTEPLNPPYKWKKIKNVAPIYPSKAARKKNEGWVDVEITIDSTGKVFDAKILRSKRNIHVFDKSALKAVKQWKYEPPSKLGINSKLSKTIRLVYKL